MGLVMNVQRFSLHDGPGVRTTAFLMGCGLRCRWCHNPESWLTKRRMMFYPNKCLRCGACLTRCVRGAHAFDGGVHSMDLAKCLDCPQLDVCSEACPGEAMVVCGREYTPDELVALMARDRVFYAEDGGVTFSGGEALMQPQFLSECLVRCKQLGLHTCVDTALDVPQAHVMMAAQHANLFLVDVKAMDDALHRRLCAVGNARILENLRLLDRLGKPVWVRVPLVHGQNDTKQELGAMANMLSGLPAVKKVDLFPVLNHAQDKYRALGMQAERFNEDADHRAIVDEAFAILASESHGALNLNRMM